MSEGFSIEVDGGTISASLGKVSARIVDEAHKVVTHAAVNVKQTMREDVEASRSFRRIAPTIGFDQVGLSAVVGPEKRRAGNLGVIAYFGGAHGGGGTVRDPQRAADEEAPRMERALLNLLDGLL